jgi:hypothetical protein
MLRVVVFALFIGLVYILWHPAPPRPPEPAPIDCLDLPHERAVNCLNEMRYKRNMDRLIRELSNAVHFSGRSISPGGRPRFKAP